MIPKVLLKDMLGNEKEVQKICLFIETNQKQELFYKIEGACGSRQFRLLTTYKKEEAIAFFNIAQEKLLEQQKAALLDSNY